MMKWFALFLSLLASPVCAAPCLGPSGTSGWGASFPQATTVAGFTYDFANEIMYVNLPQIIQYITYLNVPYSAAYGFANTKTPDTYYKQQVKPIYKYALEMDTCWSFVTETGKFITVN